MAAGVYNIKIMGQDGVDYIKKEGPPYTLRRCRHG